MSLVESNPFPAGKSAPHFELPDTVSGNLMSLDDVMKKNGVLVAFICNHCPYVKHILPELLKLGEFCADKSVGMVAISSNDVQNHPEDSPEKMKELAERLDFTFPYLYDESQKVAEDYEAACTPDFYLFDGEKKCYYHGRLDDSSPGNNLPLTGLDLKNAIINMLKGMEPLMQPPVSRGCNIKWK